MDKRELTVFDRESNFNSHIKSLVTQLKGRCIEQGIPFFVTFAVQNNEQETKYITDGNLVGDHKFVLKEDRISKHLSIECGFDTVPHNYMAVRDWDQDWEQAMDEADRDIMHMVMRGEPSPLVQNMKFNMTNVNGFKEDKDGEKNK